MNASTLSSLSHSELQSLHDQTLSQHTSLQTELSLLISGKFGHVLEGKERVSQMLSIAQGLDLSKVIYDPETLRREQQEQEQEQEQQQQQQQQRQQQQQQPTALPSSITRSFASLATALCLNDLASSTSSLLHILTTHVNHEDFHITLPPLPPRPPLPSSTSSVTTTTRAYDKYTLPPLLSRYKSLCTRIISSSSSSPEDLIAGVTGYMYVAYHHHDRDLTSILKAVYDIKTNGLVSYINENTASNGMSASSSSPAAVVSLLAPALTYLQLAALKPTILNDLPKQFSLPRPQTVTLSQYAEITASHRDNALTLVSNFLESVVGTIDDTTLLTTIKTCLQEQLVTTDKLCVDRLTKVFDSRKIVLDLSAVDDDFENLLLSTATNSNSNNSINGRVTLKSQNIYRRMLFVRVLYHYKHKHLSTNTNTNTYTNTRDSVNYAKRVHQDFVTHSNIIRQEYEREHDKPSTPLDEFEDSFNIQASNDTITWDEGMSLLKQYKCFEIQGDGVVDMNDLVVLACGGIGDNWYDSYKNLVEQTVHDMLASSIESRITNTVAVEDAIAKCVTWVVQWVSARDVVYNNEWATFVKQSCIRGFKKWAIAIYGGGNNNASDNGHEQSEDSRIDRLRSLIIASLVLEDADVIKLMNDVKNCVDPILLEASNVEMAALETVCGFSAATGVVFGHKEIVVEKSGDSYMAEAEAACRECKRFVDDFNVGREDDEDLGIVRQKEGGTGAGGRESGGGARSVAGVGQGIVGGFVRSFLG
jgi:hypothetical protein